MAKEEKVSRLGIIGIGAIPIAVTTLAATYMHERKKAVKKDKEKNNVPCPVCGMLMDGTQKKCGYCGSPVQTCASCGNIFHGEARHCPNCGTESMTAGTVTIMGMTYKTSINEPFPTHYITYSHCCCGTPFLEKASYCQLCGRKRPALENCYLRERKNEKS